METATIMPGSQTLDTERICRVCLQENEELYLLFDENYSVEGVSMSQILTDCTIYRVERYDELPHQICGQCMELARTAFKFKQRAERSYRYLIDILGDVIPKSKIDAFRSEKWTQTEKFSIYPCELCDAKFFDASDLKEHRYNAHKGESYICKICSRQFKLLRHLQSHLALAHPNEASMHNTQCTICERHFSRKEHMRRHMLKVHQVEQSPLKVRFQKKTLEEPEIDMKMGISFEEVKYMLQDTTVAGTTHWNDYTDEELEKSNAASDQINNGNPISPGNADESEDSVKHEPLTFTEKPIVKVEPVDEILPDNYVSTVLEQVKSEMPSEKLEEENIDDENIAEENIGEETMVPKSTQETIDKKPALKTVIIREYLSEKTEKRRQFAKIKDNKCPECQRVFTRHCHLLRHMLTHSAEKPYECETCQRRFTRSDHLKNHINSMHSEKQFKCDQCACAFPRNDSLQRHKKSKHTDEGQNLNKIHQCDLCEKSFTTKKYMHRHRLLHTDRIYACKNCDEMFKDRTEFREHEKTHTSSERNFLCSICGESFMRNDYLMVHMRRHTGEKPYKCKYCGKGFPRATDLNVHERYHTGHKPNLCTLCGKGFHRAYNLTIHMRTHTGERPFQCDHCPKSFAQSNDLKAHVRRHTGERFKCNNCDAGFLQLYGLRQHALAVHGIQIDTINGRLEKFPNLAISKEKLPDKQQLDPQQLQQQSLPNFSITEILPNIAAQEALQKTLQEQQQHITNFAVSEVMQKTLQLQNFAPSLMPHQNFPHIADTQQEVLHKALQHPLDALKDNLEVDNHHIH